MADPTTDDVSTIAQRLAMSYGSHVSPPEGGQDWRAAESLMPWLAEHDARIRAEALRDAADDASRIHCGYPTNPHIRSVNAIRRWLYDRADRIERGESQ